MSINVGIVGATGTVGQKFIQLLQGHPWFSIKVVGASSKSQGLTYQKAVSWKQITPIPSHVAQLQMQPCEPNAFVGCDLIFSALDSSVAGPIEEEFAKQGFAVFSNARNHRYDALVPILIPHANPQHIECITQQQISQSYHKGYIVTNANCSTTGLVIALKPLHDLFGIEKLFVVTLQAISGAGYPGVASLDITDNVVPYISGEEWKLENEILKIFGKYEEKQFKPASIAVSAHCNRVHCIDGHTECVSIKLRTPATVEQIKQAMSNYRSVAQELKLPSAPPMPIVVREEDDRPQPRLDRDLHQGYVVTVGRVRECPLFDFKFTLCSHNTVIGAAGGSILNAELAVAHQFLPQPNTQ